MHSCGHNLKGKKHLRDVKFFAKLKPTLFLKGYLQRNFSSFFVFILIENVQHDIYIPEERCHVQNYLRKQFLYIFLLTKQGRITKCICYLLNFVFVLNLQFSQGQIFKKSMRDVALYCKMCVCDHIQIQIHNPFDRQHTKISY